MMNKRLLGFRRRLFTQRATPIEQPRPYFPHIQADEKTIHEIRRDAKASHAHSRRNDALDNLAKRQRDASAGIVRCSTQAYTFVITTANTPKLILPQNPLRVFLSFIYAPGALTTGNMVFSLGNPNVQGGLAPKIGYTLLVSQEKTFSSSVIPMDDIWVTAQAGAVGSMAIVYEGISIGDLKVE